MLEQSIWRWLPAQLHLVLRPQGMQLYRVRRWPRREAHLLASLPQALPAQASEVADAVASLLDQSVVRGAALRLWLDDQLLRMWTAAPPPNAGRWSDLLAAQAQRFQKVFDEDMAEWVCAAPQSASRSYLGVAVPQPLLQGLMAGVATRDCEAASIQPESVGVWNHWCSEVPAGYWFACVEQGALRLGVTGQGALQGWRWLASGGGEAALPGVWAERLRSLSERQGLPLPKGLALCGPGAQAWQVGALPELPLRVLGQQAHIVACLGGQS